MTSFAARSTPSEQASEGREGSPRLPANPSDWLELCRKQFIKQWREQHPDDFEDATEVYGD